MNMKTIKRRNGGLPEKLIELVTLANRYSNEVQYEHMNTTEGTNKENMHTYINIHTCSHISTYTHTHTLSSEYTEIFPEIIPYRETNTNSYS